MTRQWIVLICAAFSMCDAAAIDIPMQRKLAMEALDSKTCYGMIKSREQLLGYELGGRLLVSASGRLVELEATGAFEIGKPVPRRYTGHGITVTIVPLRAMRHDDTEEALSIVLEEGRALVSERGRRQGFQVKVGEICTP